MRRRNIDRYSADSLSHYRPTIDPLSTDHRPTIDRLSTDYRPTIDRLSTDYRPTIDRLSTDYRPTVDRYIDRLSTAISTAMSTDISVDITHSKQDPRTDVIITVNTSHLIHRGLRFSPRGLGSSFLGLRFRNTPCPAPLWILIEWFNNGQICLLVTVARYWIYYGAGFRTLLAAV